MADLSFSLFIAKFTGYQYGGRPLGITYVRYNTGDYGAAANDGWGGQDQHY